MTDPDERQRLIQRLIDRGIPREQADAEPGEVLVDAALAAVAGGAAVEPLPEVEVKGFPDPVTPHRLVG